MRILPYVCRGVLIALPWLALLLLSIVSGNNCFVGQPLWSDELDYWREMYSFTYAPDHDFGYYGFENAPATVGTWGCHGIAPLLVYGFWALLFGWTSYSIVLCNAFFCSLGIAVFILLARPDVRQSLIVALLWLMYPPLLLYAPTSMMELPQYACLFVYLGLVIRSWEHASKPCFILAFASVVFMAGLRLSNIVFFAPLILMGSRFKIGRKFLILSAISLVLSVVSYLFFWMFCAGYPFGFLSSLGTQEGLLDKIVVVFAHGAGNLINFISRGDGIAQVSQRYAYIFVLIACSFFALVGFVRHRRGCDQHVVLTRVCAAIAFTMFFAWAIVVLVYDVFDWRDYRTLAPILFSALIVLVMTAPTASGRRIGAVVQGLCVFCSLCLFLCAARTLATSAAFEDERYEHVSEAPASFDAGSIVSLGEQANDKTMLMGMDVPLWLVNALPPEIGYVGGVNGSSLSEQRYAYVFSRADIGNPRGYELIWEDPSLNRAIFKRL